MMRRVAHVLRKYDPAQWGGTETHVVEVTRRLGGHGWACEVHAPSGPVARDGALASDVELRRYRAFVPFLASPERRKGLVANAGNIASLDEPLILARDRGLALAHLHTGGRIGGAVRAAMRWTRRPYVVSVHGPLLAERDLVREETRRRYGGAIDLGRPIGLLFGARRVLDDAARVIAFNDAERAAIADRIGARAVRMDHGVDAARLERGDGARGRERWPHLARGPVVLSVGRVSQQKNQLLTVRSFARGAPRDHVLALAGAQTDMGYRDEVEREARALGVADRVHFMGNLDASGEIPDLYAMATLVVAPSTHEAFGLIVLEAWAAARPILFAHRSGMADLATALGDDAEPAIGELDVDAWASAMARYLASSALREAAVARGRALVASRFAWDSVARDLARLYDEVLAETR